MGSVNVNGKTTISDILSRYPEAAEVFYGIGMHRFGWPASGGESLEEACAVLRSTLKRS